MLLKRVLLKRVERWINTLEPEFRTKGFIKASLGLFRIVGLPTDFSKLITQKRANEEAAIDGLNTSIANLSETRQGRRVRSNELTALGDLLG